MGWQEGGGEKGRKRVRARDELRFVSAKRAGGGGGGGGNLQ